MRSLFAILLFALNAWSASLEKVGLQNNFVYWEESAATLTGQNDTGVRYLLRGSGLFLRLTGNALLAQSEYGALGGVRFSSAISASRGVGRIAMRVHRFEDTPEQWRRDIPAWSAIVYDNVYPLTDVALRSDLAQTELRMKITVRPGGSPQTFAFQGADDAILSSLSIEESTGQWTARFHFLTMRFSAPVAWQEIAGRRIAVSVRMRLIPSGGLGFEVGAYDTKQPLQIETVLPTAPDTPATGSLLSMDPQGNYYLAGTAKVAENCGTTTSATRILCTDVWVAKFNPNGEAIYHTSLSGSVEDSIQSLEWRVPGELVIAGNTGSSNFPVTANALQRANAGPIGPRNRNFLGFGGDLFLARLDPASGELLYSTFFGNLGTGESGVLALSGEAAVVVLRNPSANLPVSTNAWQRVRSCEAANCESLALLRFNRDLTQLERATFLPGPAFLTTFAVHSDQSVTLLSTSLGGIWPALPTTPGALQQHPGGGRDVYLLRLRPDFSSPNFATFYGGPKDESGQNLILDAEGNILILGASREDNDQVENFLIQISADGGKLLRNLSGFAPGLKPLAMIGRPDGSLVLASSTELATIPTTADAPLRAGCAMPGQSSSFVSVLERDGATSFASYLALSAASGMSILLNGEGRLILLDNGTSPLQKLNFTAKASPRLACVTGAASRRVGLAASILQGISPGQIVTLVGAGMGPEIGQAATLTPQSRLPLNFAGVSVRFNGIVAPLLYVQASQINAIVPYEGIVPREQALVEVEYNGQKLSTSTLAAFTGVELFTTDFSGTGQAVAINEDGSLNTSSNPAQRGSIVVVYGTGIGMTQPASVTGALTPVVGPAQLPNPIGPVVAFIGIRVAEVLYAGAAPGLVSGAAQFNIRIPADLKLPTNGFVAVDIRINGSIPGNSPLIAVR